MTEHAMLTATRELLSAIHDAEEEIENRQKIPQSLKKQLDDAAGKTGTDLLKGTFSNCLFP